MFETILNHSESLFTDLKLAIDNRFLIGSHPEGVISVTDTQNQTSNIITRPFGAAEMIWSIEMAIIPEDDSP